MYRKILTGILLTLLSACFPSGHSDPELESRIRGMVEANNIVTVDNFGQTVINIETIAPFEMPPHEQLELAREIAQIAIEMDAGRDVVLVAFSNSAWEMKMLTFLWKNNNGTLELIEE